MKNIFIMDRIQLFSILFSLFVFYFIFWLVKHKKFKEEYSILWFATSLVFLSERRPCSSHPGMRVRAAKTVNNNADNVIIFISIFLT